MKIDHTFHDILFVGFVFNICTFEIKKIQKMMKTSGVFPTPINQYFCRSFSKQSLINYDKSAAEQVEMLSTLS